MTSADIEAIVQGLHRDAFRILGPHLRAGLAVAGHAAKGEVAGHTAVFEARPNSGAAPASAESRTAVADGWEVRAFLPGASEVSILIGDRQIPMERLHDKGFFLAPVPGRPRHYRLRVHYPGGRVEEREDPYRFPLLLTEFDIHLHAEGNQFTAWRMLGAHFAQCEGVDGVRFAVWAPHAWVVSVVGDFNNWDPSAHPMRLRTGGLWELFLPALERGALYQYSVTHSGNGFRQFKSDPYAFHAEVPPAQASVVWGTPQYEWKDDAWMERRARTNFLEQPVSIYEVHLGSWLRVEEGRPLTYRELADSLVPYARNLGYTHIELLPIMEHPFSGSWGYQITGYYAPTSRFGPPEDFLYFVDRCHQAGLGVILDWVPAHFPRDAHGLARFDGTALYEHEDPREGAHLDWGTLIFNYGRNEVRSFLLSNALFWLKHCHIDGLRVDAVASMVYRDYSRPHGQWIPNRYGGRENLEAIDFLRRFNELVHEVPGAFTVAEESTSFPSVTRPVYLGGLGFTMKWNMGWMHDMLRYFKVDPVYRKFHQNDITFSLLYAFSENFMLPISHDEVVHLKRSLLGKMPGDEWQRFANARAFLAYMYGHPGKKLLFMGQEIGQYEEWNEEASVRWDLLGFAYHRNLQATVRELNRLYRREPALYQVDFHWDGFEWVDIADVDQSVITFLRFARDRADFLLFVCNFTPVPRPNYRIGVPRSGVYREIFNTDWRRFSGSGVANSPAVEAQPVSWHGRPASLEIILPPLSVSIFKPEPEPEPAPPR